MRQMWTIIFITLFMIGWGLAAWHDLEERKRRQRREAASVESGNRKK